MVISLLEKKNSKFQAESRVKHERNIKDIANETVLVSKSHCHVVSVSG